VDNHVLDVLSRMNSKVLITIPLQRRNALRVVAVSLHWLTQFPLQSHIITVARVSETDQSPVTQFRGCSA
jgi:hypothetical protein